VRHNWQLSKDFGLSEFEARRVCALVCLKAVLDYKVPTNAEGFPLGDIIMRTSAHGGKTEDGWLHRAEVATLKDYGLNAWRRDWRQSSYFETLSDATKEGYDQVQLNAVAAQVLMEPKNLPSHNKAISSIIDSIDARNPVIASVKPGFSQNDGPHQIIIHGYETSPSGIDMLVTDPIIEDAAHQEQLVSEQYFAYYFRQRAIFVNDHGAL
jgi:hypothetical protein